MPIELNKEQYDYLQKCLTDMGKSHYCSDIAKNVVIDNAIANLGFKKEPTYTVELNITDTDRSEMLDYINSLHKTDYKRYDYYVDFHNILNDFVY